MVDGRGARGVDTQDSSQGPRARAGLHEAASIAFQLLQVRHDLRDELGLPHDAHDHLADELRDILDETLAADARTPLTVLYWPAEEFAGLLERWPGLSESYGDPSAAMEWGSSDRCRSGGVRGGDRRGTPLASVKT